MTDFSVDLDIIDLCCSKGFNNKIQKSLTITDTQTTLLLQCNYTLNVINITEEYITILIQDGINVIVSNVYTTFTSEICITSCKNISHTLFVSCSITEI